MNERRKRVLILSTITNLVRHAITRMIIVQSNRLDRLGFTACIAQELQRIPHAVLTELPSFPMASSIGGDRGHFVP